MSQIVYIEPLMNLSRISRNINQTSPLSRHPSTEQRSDYFERSGIVTKDIQDGTDIL